MKNLVRLAPLILLSLVLGVITITSYSRHAQAQAKAPHYVCDPCGLPCDESVYDQPGTCPKCGMPLVDQETAAKKSAARASKKVAILIFDGVEIIDYTGPWEVFGAAGFDVYTVAGTKEPITTAMGMTVLPKYTFADAPQPDVLVVPGGGVTEARNSAPTLKWVTGAAARTAHTMSVCNGAFILASAALLDGLTATTTSGNIPRLKAEYPKTKVVDDQRFVDNGRIITTAGLSAGIDGALHVVSLMLGHGMAQKVALAEEYEWRPDAPFVRAALADRLIPDVDLDAIGNWTLVSTEGGRDHWEIAFRGTSDLSATEVMDHIGRDLTTKGKWTSVAGAVNAATAATGSPSTRTSRWKFNGTGGKPWTGTVTIEATPTAKGHQYTGKLTIARAA
jgi:putative intracellular protease/amidase